MISSGKIEDISVASICRLYHIDPESVDSYQLSFDGKDTVIEFFDNNNKIVAKFVNGEYSK